MTHLASDLREADDFAEYSTDPLGFSLVRGMPAALAARGQGWVDCGAEPVALLAALRSVPGPPTSAEWVAHFRAEADRSDGLAEGARLAHSAFYSFLARWPVSVSAESGQAYRRHLADFLQLRAALGRPVEVVDVPSADGPVRCHLHHAGTSAGSTERPPAVVLVTGGLDAWKSDPETVAVVDALLDAGLSVLAMDSPGTGESPVAAGPDAERSHCAVIDHLAGRSDVDATRLGLAGLSFGGHWAVKLALTDRRVRAAVNISGPLHHAFAADWLAGLQLPTLLALAEAVRQEPTALTEPGALAGMSLVEQGVFDAPFRPRLLSIYGAHDTSVPLADLDEITARGVEQDTLLFGRDRHCASFHYDLHLPFAAAWLGRELARA
jgi:esterase FrsA